jgi:hypothetical protein
MQIAGDFNCCRESYHFSLLSKSPFEKQVAKPFFGYLKGTIIGFSRHLPQNQPLLKTDSEFSKSTG